MSYWVYVMGAMVCWGLWGFLPKLATSNLNFKDATVWEWIGMLAVALPCLWLIGGRPATGNGSFIYALLTGVAGLGGALLYYKAMSLCGPNVANVVVVSALYPVVSILLTIVFLQQKLNMGQLLGIVLCLVGTAVVARFSQS